MKPISVIFSYETVIKDGAGAWSVILGFGK
jgi:hypothetical protein